MPAHNSPHRQKYFFQISLVNAGMLDKRLRLLHVFLNILAGLRHPRSSNRRKAFRTRALQRRLTYAAPCTDDKSLKPLWFNFAAILLHPFSSRRRKAFRAELKPNALQDVQKLTLGEPFFAKQRRINEFLQSDLYSEIIVRASLHDPLVRKAARTKYAIFPPFHDPQYAVHESILEKLPRGELGTVIFIPWLRMGGADYIACLLAAAVRSIRPNERVLVLRTDSPHMERLDWVPHGITTIDISGPLKLLSDAASEYVLHTILRGLAAKRIINVNSRLCWRVFARFGDRLARESNLYAYLFCWDLTPKGKRVGYPSEFFSPTAPFLNAIFTDSDYLKTELIKTYRPSAEVTEKVITLLTPAQGPVWPVSAQELSQRNKFGRTKPRILWAGRLDRQKRFDIVEKIAVAMPDIEFLCWGVAVVDPPPNISRLPSNLVVRAPYKTFEELPLADSDLWLFTSDWEGTPTIIIELAVRGVAMVGTSVGGVSELLDEVTGWPVPVGSPAEVYAATIRRALERPEARLVRAAALQERAVAQYTSNQYNQSLRELFDREANH